MLLVGSNLLPTLFQKEGCIMKIGTVEKLGENIQDVFFPRNDGGIMFKLRAVREMDTFEEVCPEPKPQIKMYPKSSGRAPEPWTDEPAFLKATEAYGEQRFNWMFLKSISATEDLAWSTVDIMKSETWNNWREEIKEFGLNEVEIMKLITGMMRANSIDESYLEEAKKSFLAQKQDALELSSSLVDGQSNT